MLASPAPRALVLGHRWPEPTATAAGSRTLRLLRWLVEQGWAVTFATSSEPGEEPADLGAEGVATRRVRLNDSAFDAWVRELAPGLVLYDRFMTEEQFGWRVAGAAPDAVQLLDTVDLHFLRKARRRAVEEERDLEPGDLRGPEAQREVAAIHRVDLALVISEAEHALLVEELEVSPEQLAYLPFLLDLEGGAGAAVPGFEEREGFVSLGTFRHGPNADAVRWTKEAVWPRIRELLPGATLRVYGAYPTPAALALDAPGEGFRVLGRAPDADAVMRAARVCLAPLRFGAGLKGKLVDAMRAGTPSVTTAVGAEGLAGERPWPGAVREDPRELAAAAVELHEDRGLWEEASGRAPELLRARLDARVHGPRLAERLGALRADLAAARRRNFTGAMLRHHRQRACEYFSRWLEAKAALAARDSS